MLGLANSIGSILQFGQIPIGAISDRTTTRRCGGLLGRRRPYVLLGQAIVCLSLVIMHPAVAKTYSVLAAGYATFMLGNALVWAPYFVVTADVVPPAQRGVEVAPRSRLLRHLGRVPEHLRLHLLLLLLQPTAHCPTSSGSVSRSSLRSPVHQVHMSVTSLACEVELVGDGARVGHEHRRLLDQSCSLMIF